VPYHIVAHSTESARIASELLKKESQQRTSPRLSLFHMFLSRHSRDPRDYRPPAPRRQRDFERVKDKKKAKSLSTERLPCTLSPTARLNKKYDEKHQARLGNGCFMDRGNFSPRCVSSTVVPQRLYHGEIAHPLPSFSSTYFCDVNTTRKVPRDLYTSVSYLVEAESGLSLSMGRSNFLFKASPSKWASCRAFFPSRWEALRLMNEFNGRTVFAGEVSEPFRLINILSKSTKKNPVCNFH